MVLKNEELTKSIIRKSYNNEKLIISGLIGDVHLVIRCEIFSEAP